MVLYSKRAREERALAAEQRTRAHQGKVASSSNLLMPRVVGDDPESDDEKRDSETDCDRRRTLLEVIEEKELDALRATTLDSAQHFLLPGVGSSGQCGTACGVDWEDARDAVSGGFGRINTSPSAENSMRPRKKQKTSQSKLIFTPRGTSAVTETKAKCEDAWDCMVCTL